MTCNPDWTFWGPGALITGGLFLHGALRVWTRPREVRASIAEGFEPWVKADDVSAFLGLTRERATGPIFSIWRILSPLLGTILALGGIWATVTEIRCGFPLVGPIAFRSLNGPEIIGLILWFLLTIIWPAWANRSNPRRASVLWLVLFTLLATLAVFAGVEGEASGYHSHIQSDRWAALSLVVWATLVIIIAVAVKHRRSG